MICKLKLFLLCCILSTATCVIADTITVPYIGDTNTGAGEGLEEPDPSLGGATPGDGIGSPTGDISIDNEQNAQCPDTELLSGKMISSTCWTCLFPIISMGIPLGADEDEAPANRADSIFCLCKDKIGVPYPGFVYGMWIPSKAMEFVRKPGCLATLNGATLGFNPLMQGTWAGAESKEIDSSFAHYHYYAYPLLLVLDLFAKAECIKDNFADIDVLFMSEVDPTWNDDMLAYFTNPEAVLFGNPVAMTACIADALSANTMKRPISSMFWCAGSWGSIFPLSGNVVGLSGGTLRDASLMSARMLQAFHRRGFMKLTYTEEAMCQPKLAVTMPKEQYKITMLYPVPEIKSAHVIGESTVFWGANRIIPVTGEDLVFLLWTWNDCCMSIVPGNAN